MLGEPDALTLGAEEARLRRQGEAEEWRERAARRQIERQIEKDRGKRTLGWERIERRLSRQSRAGGVS